MNKILLFASIMAVATITSCSEDEEKVVDQSSLELNKKEITIEETKTETLKATLTPAKEGDTYAWDSENKEIATVDQNGVVTARKIGSTTISVTVRNLTATCKVTVTDYAIIIPDKAFRTYLLNNIEINKTNDGKITKKEAADFTGTIDISGKSEIENLEGIEYFKNLSSLDCSSTGIRVLNLDQNTCLENLYCSSTGIKLLYPKNNPGLYRLHCKNCPSLEGSGTEKGQLNLSNNELLEFVECTENLAIKSILTCKDFKFFGKWQVGNIELIETTE